MRTLSTTLSHKGLSNSVPNGSGEKEPTAKPNAIARAVHPCPRIWREHVYTAAELQHKKFPPIAYCVPDLIPEGLTIIAGKPKIGKSWMALDICVAIAGGRFCLGDRKPIQGDVLYAAMEDNERRMQRRIDKSL